MDAVNLATLAVSWGGFFTGLFVILFILICILLIGVILLQKGRGGGLSSAFGGAGSSSPFGAKTGDVFTWITVVLAALFLVVAVVLHKFYVPVRAEAEATPTEQVAPPGNDAGEVDDHAGHPHAPGEHGATGGETTENGDASTGETGDTGEPATGGTGESPTPPASGGSDAGDDASTDGGDAGESTD